MGGAAHLVGCFEIAQRDHITRYLFWCCAHHGGFVFRKSCIGDREVFQVWAMQDRAIVDDRFKRGVTTFRNKRATHKACPRKAVPLRHFAKRVRDINLAWAVKLSAKAALRDAEAKRLGELCKVCATFGMSRGEDHAQRWIGLERLKMCTQQGLVFTFMGRGCKPDGQSCFIVCNEGLRLE